MEQCGRDMLFREAVIHFLGADPDKSKGSKNFKLKKVGEYCKGNDVAECGGYFGSFLSNVCATCPQ